MKEISTMPNHVAIIMDGNGRWAKLRGLPRSAGHKAGVENIPRVVRAFAKYGVKYLTLFAFSTENWNRPREEVEGLLKLLADKIDQYVEELNKEGVRLRHIGRIDGLTAELREKVIKAIELTKNNSSLTLSIAFDYGGRLEIVEAARAILERKIPPHELSESLFSKFLYTADLPDPDLIIRTSGEQRLSNFLLWQAAYSELYFTPVYWPDFDEGEVRKALIEYSKRHRRFGSL